MAETTDVLVAGYQDIDEATKDFEALVALVKEKQVSIEGVILVTHAQDGSVCGAADGRPPRPQGRRAGAAASASRSGLFAPPLLASVAVGAVAGGLIGKFVDHRVENEIHDKIGENLPPGSAGIIAVFDDEQRLAVEQALAGSPAQVGRAERQVGHRRAEGRRSPRRWGSSSPIAPCCRSRTRTSAGRSAGRSTSRSPTGRST